MSQPASDATAAAYRRKTYVKLIIFIILMLIVWLQPKVETWLENRKAGGAAGSDIVANNDFAPADNTEIPSNRSKVVIKDVDEPVVAEVDRTHSTSARPAVTIAPATSDSQAATEKAKPSSSKSSTSKATPSKSGQKTETGTADTTKSNKSSQSDVVRMDRDTGGRQRTADAEPTTSKNSTASSSGPSTASSDKSQAKDTPALGELREIRDYVFESTAGLLYVKGSADGHRLKHVMKHARDDLSKPKHGVFEGDRDQILAVIDEAFEKTKKSSKDVRKSEQGERTVYIVNLGRKIGYVGGSSGERSGNPDCRYVQLVLEDENVVITAYPTKSF